MLAHASFPMVSKKIEEECSQELNEKMYALIDYREEDCTQCSVSEFQIALDEIKKFQVVFDSNFIAMSLDQQI